MFECFRGWKRKAGLLSLVVTCLFVAAWVRSMIVVDILGIVSETTSRVLVSGNHEFLWAHERNSQKRPSSVVWQTFPNKPGIIGSSRHGILSIPYWSIVLPMTALSACLLLSKRRQPIQAERTA